METENQSKSVKEIVINQFDNGNTISVVVDQFENASKASRASVVPCRFSGAWLGWNLLLDTIRLVALRSLYSPHSHTKCVCHVFSLKAN